MEADIQDFKVFLVKKFVNKSEVIKFLVCDYILIDPSN